MGFTWDDIPEELRKGAIVKTVAPSIERRVSTNVDPRRKPRPNKYHAQATVWNGIRFDSKGEAEYASDLDVARQLGAIRWVLYQVPVRLGVSENRMVVDFMVGYPDGTVCFFEWKGRRTPKFERDVKLWRRFGPEMLVIESRGGQEIIPRGTEVGKR